MIYPQLFSECGKASCRLIASRLGRDSNRRPRPHRRRRSAGLQPLDTIAAALMWATRAGRFERLPGCAVAERRRVFD